MKKTPKPIIDVKWIVKHFGNRIDEATIKNKFTVVQISAHNYMHNMKIIIPNQSKVK